MGGIYATIRRSLFNNKVIQKEKNMILLMLINTLLLVVVYHKLNRKERAKFVHNEQIFCSIILY